MKPEKGTLFKTSRSAWPTVPDEDRSFVDRDRVRENTVGIFIHLDLYDGIYYILYLDGNIVSIDSRDLDKI